MSAMGRPKKLDDTREIFSIYMDLGKRQAMDEYVHERKAVERGYSRSDFVNEAIAEYLVKLGRGKF